MKKRDIILILVLFIATLFFVHIFYIDKISDTFFKEISLAGTLASSIGLILVLIQISKLKTVAEGSELASKQTKDQLLSFLSAIDIGKATKIIHETKIYNRNNKYELSIVRMQELKEILILIKNHPRYKDFIDIKYYNKLISNTSIDINSMEKSNINHSDNTDPVFLNKNLDIILTSLNDLQSKVRLEGV